MIDLSSHIEYLLLRHDCVVVPGFGAFLVHETSARYDIESGMFFPPSRSLGFNPVVTHNDGLLVESIARKEHVSIETAIQHVQAETTSFLHQLSISGELPVGSLGVMTKGEDSILFQPAGKSAVALRYNGLPSLPLKPLAEEGADDLSVDSVVKAQPAVIPLPLKIAASIIFLLVACGIIFSTTNLVDSGTQTYASLDSGLSERVEASYLTGNNDADDVSREILLNIAIPMQDVDTSNEETIASTDGRYLLVVASLPSRKAAEAHISSIGNPSDLSIIDMDGKYRVFAKKCRTIDEALAESELIRAQYPNVWVCKR